MTMDMMEQGSTPEAIGYADAENRLMTKAKYRYKAGRVVEPKSTSRANGWYQRPKLEHPTGIGIPERVGKGG